MDYPAIENTVDVVLLGAHPSAELGLSVALKPRVKKPYAGRLALPGGYVHAQSDLDVEETAQRVLRQKIGVDAPYLEQLGVWSGRLRDERGWSLSVVFFTLIRAEQVSLLLDKGVQWVPVTDVPRLPFDHNDIVRTAVERVRSKGLYTTLPAHLCGDDFTLAELQRAYEIVRGQPVPKMSFLAKLKELDAFEEVPGVKRSAGGRSAQVYRLKPQYRQELAFVDRGLSAPR